MQRDFDFESGRELDEIDFKDGQKRKANGKKFQSTAYWKLRLSAACSRSLNRRSQRLYKKFSQFFVMSISI